MVSLLGACPHTIEKHFCNFFYLSPMSQSLSFLIERQGCLLCRLYRHHRCAWNTWAEVVCHGANHRLPLQRQGGCEGDVGHFFCCTMISDSFQRQVVCFVFPCSEWSRKVYCDNESFRRSEKSIKLFGCMYMWWRDAVGPLGPFLFVTCYVSFLSVDGIAAFF